MHFYWAVTAPGLGSQLIELQGNCITVNVNLLTDTI